MLTFERTLTLRLPRIIDNGIIMVRLHLTAIAALLPTSLAWWPGHKIRGVNLGSLFVFEPWIATTEWSNIGCGGQESEFDCVMNTGQQRSNEAFQRHWDSWITESDLDEMMSYGINTIRVPLGYWIQEELVYDSEHFPRASIPDLFGLQKSLTNLGR